MGSTLPRSVSSPVMATSWRTGMPGDQRHQRAGHGDARRRAVLGHAAGGDVDVDLAPGVELARSPSVSACARANDSAACADSFITSPSWPVRISDPLPAHDLRLDVQHLAAVRRPGQAVALPTSSPRAARRRGSGGGPRNLAARRGRSPTWRRRCASALAARAPASTTRRATLRASVRHQPLQLAQPRLARVLGDDAADDVAPDDDLLGGQARLGDLLGHQVALARSPASPPRCSRRAQRLHAIAQRRGNRRRSGWRWR